MAARSPARSSQGRLAQAGGTAEKDVVQRLSAALGRFDEDAQVALYFLLTNIFLQRPGP